MHGGHAHARSIVEDLLEEEQLVWNSVGLAGAEVSAALAVVSQGKIVARVHGFFNELQPRKCCTKLTPQKRRDCIRLVQDHEKYPRSHSSYPSVDPPALTLLEKDTALYKHVYACVHWPILSSSAGSSPSPSYTRSPVGDEGVRYGAVAAESLVKYMRNIFAFPVSSTAKLEKEVRSRQHTKALIEELVNQLAILEQNRHPFYLPSSFATRAGYELWQKTHRRRIETLIAKFWHQPLPAPTTGNLDFPLRDRHIEYKSLVNRLVRYEAHCRRMEGTDDSVAMQLMSTASGQILREYSLRYGIGDVYRHVALLSTFAELFDCSLWFLSCTSLALSELWDAMQTPTNRLLMTRAERDILAEQLEGIRENCANFTVHMKDRFPENKPAGGVALLIRLIGQLKDVEQLIKDTISTSVSDDLQSYVKRGLQIIYEKHKAAAAESLGIAKAQRMLSPNLLYEMLVYVTDEVSDYQANFHKEFSGYFNVTQLAALELYRYLMDDVIALNEQAAACCDSSCVDVLMLGLAYRLSSLDKDWSAYIPPAEQRWREHFRLVHVVCWLNAIKQHMKVFVQEACEADDFKAVSRHNHHKSRASSKPNLITQPIVSSPSSPFTAYGSVHRRSLGLPARASPPLPATEPSIQDELNSGTSNVSESPSPSAVTRNKHGYVVLSPESRIRQPKTMHPAAGTAVGPTDLVIRRDGARRLTGVAAAASDTTTKAFQHQLPVDENHIPAMQPVIPSQTDNEATVAYAQDSSDGQNMQQQQQLPWHGRPALGQLSLSDDNVASSSGSGSGGTRSMDASTPSSGRPSFGTLIITHPGHHDDSSPWPSGQFAGEHGYNPDVPVSATAGGDGPTNSAATVMISSCLIDTFVVALRFENFVQTLVSSICLPPMPSTVAQTSCSPGGAAAMPVPVATEKVEVIVVDAEAVEASSASELPKEADDGKLSKPCAGAIFPAASDEARPQSGDQLDDRLVQAQDSLCSLSVQVLCSLFVMLAERLLLTDVESMPGALLDSCVPPKLLAQLRRLDQGHASLRPKVPVNEELWLQQLDEKINSKMCLRINDVLLLCETLPYFHKRLVDRLPSSLAGQLGGKGDRGGSESVHEWCSEQLHAIYDAQVALLARQIYFVLILPSRTAQIIRQLEMHSKLKEAAFEAKMRNVVQCSFEASLKSVVSFLKHYLYPTIAADVLYRIWQLLCEHFEQQLFDLPLHGDCERKAVIMLMMISCLITLLTKKDVYRSLSVDKLLGDCEHIIFKLDLYSTSLMDLSYLYQELAGRESAGGARRNLDEERAAAADSAYVEQMRKDLHSRKKCFSGEELYNYILQHPPASGYAERRLRSLSDASWRTNTTEFSNAQEMSAGSFSGSDALRICDALLHDGTIVCVDALAYIRSYPSIISEGSSARSSIAKLTGTMGSVEDNADTTDDDSDSSTPCHTPPPVKSAERKASAASNSSRSRTASNTTLSSQMGSVKEDAVQQPDRDDSGQCGNPVGTNGRHQDLGKVASLLQLSAGFCPCIYCTACCSISAFNCGNVANFTSDNSSNESCDSHVSSGTSHPVEHPTELANTAATIGVRGRRLSAAGNASYSAAATDAASEGSGGAYGTRVPVQLSADRLQAKKGSIDSAAGLSDYSDSTASLSSQSFYCFASLLGQYYGGTGSGGRGSTREHVLQRLQTARLAEQCTKYNVRTGDVAAVLTARSRLQH